MKFDITVEEIPKLNASVAFTPGNIEFRENTDVVVSSIADGIRYVRWGGDNMLPYRILDRFEEDETLNACADFLAEVTYAGGIRYAIPELAPFAEEVEDFFLDNDMPAYFLGVCHDLKMFEFAVSVLLLSEDGTRIKGVWRKEACYCRFAPADNNGKIPYVVYANWRRTVTKDSAEVIPLLDSRCLLDELEHAAASGIRKVAVVTKVPKADSMYYPIPGYGSLFRGHWYNIKKFIAVAKEAKLKNSAPIKYLIEISQKYWEDLFRKKRITDAAEKLTEVNRVKKELIDFLTGARNSGKAIFSNFYVSPDGREVHDIKITKIEDDKEGGDWASDHAEAINMLCFAMRVHSNLVGSVPGKSQSNNSGSDKRELYTIAQALQKPYRDIAFRLHRAICAFNAWHGVKVLCPMLQLTTLDEHKDVKEVDA